MWDEVRAEQSLCSFPLSPTESPPMAQGCFTDSELHTPEENKSSVHLLPLQGRRWPLAAESCIALNKFCRVHSISFLWPQCAGVAAGSVSALSSWWSSGELTSLWPPAFLHIMERYFMLFASLSCSLTPVLQQVKENFARIQACISELRALPAEGCFPQGRNGVVQAVQDGLQQFKQYSRHTAAGGSTNSSVEVRKRWEGSGGHATSSCCINFVYFVCSEHEKMRYSALWLFQRSTVQKSWRKISSPQIPLNRFLWKRGHF